MNTRSAEQSSATGAELVRLITGRLEAERERLRHDFEQSVAQVGVRYCALDDLLPDAMAAAIYAAFPPVERMRLMDSFREKKYTSKNLKEFAPLLTDITFAIQAPQVIALIGAITGIQEQVPDPSLYAGGLSSMTQGHFLGPHIDNSHDAGGKLYRTVNVLYYVTPDWSLECGGNLELWDRGVRQNTTIVSRFNRLVVMETNPWSWHSVSSVVVPRSRCCVSNYYFSHRSPTGQPYRNVTSFSARPENKLGRALAWADGRLRQFVRLIVSSGVGRKDVYEDTPR